MNDMLESKIGKYFIIAYALFAIGTYVYVFFCGEGYCAVYIVVPIMPWAFILVEDLGFAFPWVLYPIFVLLNASVVYVVGATIEWGYNRYLDYKDIDKLKILEQKKTKLNNT
jgi:hypothetical protein